MKNIFRLVCVVTLAIIGACAPSPPPVASPQPSPSPTSPTSSYSPTFEPGVWATDDSAVFLALKLEIRADGEFSLTSGGEYAATEVTTGTWSLQDDGSLALEDQPYVAVPHGNLLTLDGRHTDEVAAILYRVSDDGALLPYEPANASTVPRIDPSAVRTIMIVDSWTGLSPAAPIKALFRLQPATDCFTGTAEFSVGGYSGAAINRSVPITVPLPVMGEFLDLLESTPLEVGDYKPVMDHTDDYPTLRIAVRGKAGLVEFTSQSQGEQHIPWRVQLGGPDAFVTYAGTPAQALDLLDPYLGRAVQKEMIDQVPGFE